MSTRPGSSSSCFITSHCFDSSTMSRTIAYRADAKRPLPVLPCPLPISQPLLGIPSQTSLITPPISPNSQPFDLPPSSGVMADLAVRSTDSPSLGADDATAFQAHLLALLKSILPSTQPGHFNIFTLSRGHVSGTGCHREGGDCLGAASMGCGAYYTLTFEGE